MKNLILLISLLSTLSLPAQWVQTGGPEGSRVNGLQVVGNDIWAATDGGLFISSNQGTYWTPADFLPEHLEIISMLIDGDQIHLATRYWDGTDQGFVHRLYSSPDGGGSWSDMAYPFQNQYASSRGLFRVQGELFYQEDHQLFQLEAGSQSWLPLLLPDYLFGFAAADDYMFVARIDAVLRSSNLGVDWVTVATDGGFGDIYLEDSLLLVAGSDNVIMRSADLGDTWFDVPMDYDHWVNFRRGASGRLYSLSNDVLFSEDDGVTWTDTGIEISPYATVTELLETTDGQLLIGTNRGLFKTTGPGGALVPASNNLIGTAIWGMVGTGDGIVAGQAYDNYRWVDASNTWESIALSTADLETVAVRNDTTYAAVGEVIVRTTNDFVTVDTVGTAPVNTDLYRMKYEGGRFYLFGTEVYYTNDFVNWTQIDVIIPGWPYVSETNDVLVTDDGTLLFLVDNYSVARSVDDGLSWSEMLYYFTPGVLANSLHRIDNRILLVDNGDWYVSIDQGLTWTIQELNGLPSPVSERPTRVAFAGGIIYAVGPDYRVYTSLDRGDNWELLNEGLEQVRANALYATDEAVFVGTFNAGVYRRPTQFKPATGLVYRDANGDETYTPGEAGVENVLVESQPLGMVGSTDGWGRFALAVAEPGDTIRAVPPGPYVSVHPPFYLANAVLDSFYFGLQPIPGMKDLRLTLTPSTVFRPGFTNEIHFTVTNVGTVLRTPTVRWPIPENVVVDTIPFPAVVQTADSVIWTLPVLLPGESVTVSAAVTPDAAVAIGTQFQTAALVYPLIDDLTPADNQYTLDTEVVGAYDPNDKQVEPEGLYTPDMAASNQPLRYTIRFQNTGNYPAETVRITDTIAEGLDLTSFELLAAGHDVTWSLRPDRVLEFTFANIFLPDSVNNEPESHGFVKFSIQPVRQLQLGDEISNFADIYFDFNDPIRTNTIVSRYDQPTSIYAGPLRLQRRLELQPNPTSEGVWWSVDEPGIQAGTLELFDAEGRQLSTNRIPARTGSGFLPTRMLPAGWYTLRLRVGEQLWSSKLVVQ